MSTTLGLGLWTLDFAPFASKQNARPPEWKEACQHGQNMEEGDFAGARAARAMPDAGLSDTVAKLLRSCEHLCVDKETRRFGKQIGECFLTKYFEGAIAIAHARPKKGAHELVVAPGIKAPMPRILPLGAVADRDVIPVSKANQGTQVVQIKLTIGVGEGDTLEARRLEPGT